MLALLSEPINPWLNKVHILYRNLMENCLNHPLVHDMWFRHMQATDGRGLSDGEVGS